VQDLMALLSEDAVRGSGLPDAELFYVAPELLLGQPPDAQSDVFTVGAIVYEMATGRRPYEATTLPTLLGAMLRTTPQNPRAVQPDLPESAAAGILRALSSDRAIRFASIAELNAALV
jgi:serine/threonine-protein kinase